MHTYSASYGIIPIKLKIIGLNLAILTFIFRTAIPFLKYTFLILFFLILMYQFLFERNQIVGVKPFIKVFSLVIILISIMVFFFFFSNKIYLSVFKEIINSLILLLLFFILNLNIRTNDNLKYFVGNFINLIIFFSVLISLCGLLTKMAVVNFPDLLNIDYNFALLPVYFGIFAIIQKLNYNFSSGKRIFFNVLLLICSLQVILSGSRRGLIMLIGLILFFVFIFLFPLINTKVFNKGFFQRTRKSIVFYSAAMIFSIGLLFFFFFYAPMKIKNNALNFLGTKKESIAKLRITNSLYKYTSVFESGIDFPVFYRSVWSPVLDSYDPDNGWGCRVHSTVFPLTGKDVEIVPANSKGYMMDKSCDAGVSNRDAYSITNIWNSEVHSKDCIRASVYCYVSDNFDGDWIRITSDGSVLGKTSDYYNMNKRGCWQRLEISSRCTDGNATVSISFCKKNNVDFNSLNGYVIFACPSITLVRNMYNFNPADPESGWGYRKHKTIFPLFGKNVEIVPDYAKGYMMDSTCDADTWDNNAYSFSPLDIIATKKSDSIYASVFCYVSPDFNGSWVSLRSEGTVPDWSMYNLNRIGIWQKLEIKGDCKDGETPVMLYFSKEGVTDFSTLKGYVIFAFPQFSIINKENNNTLESEAANVKIRPEREESHYENFSNVIYPAGKRESSIYSTNCWGDRSDSSISDNSDNTYLKLLNGSKEKYILAGFFEPAGDIFNIDTSDISSKDKIRKFTRKIISEDTAYTGFKENIIVNTDDRDFIKSRLQRWSFALKIYTREYSLGQKIFGGGFNFLNWYGYVFLHDKTRSDYPHNPFLYVLLYSGIIGVVLYSFLIYRALRLYIRFFKQYTLFFVFFCITYSFTFFSGGDPFDPPIMGFLIMLPFLLKSTERNLDKLESL